MLIQRVFFFYFPELSTPPTCPSSVCSWRLTWGPCRRSSRPCSATCPQRKSEGEQENEQEQEQEQEQERENEQEQEQENEKEQEQEPEKEQEQEQERTMVKLSLDHPWTSRLLDWIGPVGQFGENVLWNH